MGVIILLAVTFFAAIITASVLLIQTGGWLAIFTAILLLFCGVLSSAVIFAAGLMGSIDKKKKEKEA